MTTEVHEQISLPGAIKHGTLLKHRFISLYMNSETATVSPSINLFVRFCIFLCKNRGPSVGVCIRVHSVPFVYEPLKVGLLLRAQAPATAETTENIFSHFLVSCSSPILMPRAYEEYLFI